MNNFFANPRKISNFNKNRGKGFMQNTQKRKNTEKKKNDTLFRFYIFLWEDQCPPTCELSLASAYNVFESCSSTRDNLSSYFTMVLVIDGNSEIGAHVRTNLCY